MEFCEKLKLKIQPNGQLARLGDGCTLIASVGEVDVVFTRDKWSVRFQAIVVEKLNSDIYGGMNFLIENDISMRPKTGEIKVLNKHTVFQTNMLMPPPQLRSVTSESSITVQLPKCVLFPKYASIWEDFSSSAKDKHCEEAALSVILPLSFKNDANVIVASRDDNKVKDWPPTQICPVKDGTITIINESNKPVSIPRDVRILDVKHTDTVPATEIILRSKPYQPIR